MKKSQIEASDGTSIDEVDQTLATHLCRFARAQISPLCSFWGGIICQEAIKFTGKFTPLR